MPSKYKIIQSVKELDQVIEYCKQTGYASIDFETNGKKLSDPDGKPTVMGVSFQAGFSYVLPLYHFESKFNKKWLKLLRRFGKAVCEDSQIIKVCWNTKFEMKWFLKYGIQMRGIVMDGMLAKHLLDENTPNDLKTCVRNSLPEFSDYEDEVDILKKKYGGWDKIPLEPLAKYNGLDCDLTLRLMWFYEQRLMDGGFYNLFRNSSMMSTRVLAESELMGFPVDREYLEGLVDKYGKLIEQSEYTMRSKPAIGRYNKAQKRQKLKDIIKKIEAEIEELEDSDKPTKNKLIANRQAKINNLLEGRNLTGKNKVEDINFGSPQQLVKLLYTSKKGLKLPKQYKKNNKKEMVLSTEEKALEAIRKWDTSGFVEALLNHRSLTKLNSTYVEGMLPHLSKGDRVHCNYNIHGTVTGRFSSSGPNMQNIPRVTTNADIKQMFLPPPNYLLMEVDYAQAELRIVAELANETEMIEWFNNKISVHVAVACKAEGANYDEVYPITKDKKHPKYAYWTKRKKRAKTINFGILYGQTEMKLCETLNLELEPGEKPVTVAEAKKFMDEWFELFPRIAKWIKKQHRLVKKKGHVYNMFGRKRRLYDSIESGKDWLIQEACRQAVNTPVQGTSADFTNLAAIVIREKKQQGVLPWDFSQAYTVHDSIGFFIKPKYIEDVAPKIIALCSDPETMPYFGFKLKKVKMKVEPEIGTKWANIEEWKSGVDYSKLLNSND